MLADSNPRPRMAVLSSGLDTWCTGILEKATANGSDRLRFSSVARRLHYSCDAAESILTYITKQNEMSHAPAQRK